MINRYYRNKIALNNIKGKKLKNITTGWCREIILEFEDGTKAEIDFTLFPDGTIDGLNIEIEK